MNSRNKVEDAENCSIGDSDGGNGRNIPFFGKNLSPFKAQGSWINPKPFEIYQCEIKDRMRRISGSEKELTSCTTSNIAVWVPNCKNSAQIVPFNNGDVNQSLSISQNEVIVTPRNETEKCMFDTFDSQNTENGRRALHLLNSLWIVFVQLHDFWCFKNL